MDVRYGEWNSHDRAVASLKCPAHGRSAERRQTLVTVHVGVGPRLSGSADNRAGGALTRREKIGDGICKKKASERRKKLKLKNLKVKKLNKMQYNHTTVILKQVNNTIWRTDSK